MNGFVVPGIQMPLACLLQPLSYVLNDNPMCRCATSLAPASHDQWLCDLWLIQQSCQDHTASHGGVGPHSACSPFFPALAEEQAIRLCQVKTCWLPFKQLAQSSKVSQHA